MFELYNLFWKGGVKWFNSSINAYFVNFDKITLMVRWLGFIISILIGLALGLYYTWVVNPVQVVDTTPATLRQDYKTDYVLMVAEVYQVQLDVSQAGRSLALLGGENPAEVVRQALQYAVGADYDASEQELLIDLLQGIQQNAPNPTGEPIP